MLTTVGVETVNFFLAFLAIGGLLMLVVVAGCLLLRLVGKTSEPSTILGGLRPAALPLACLAAVVATSGSLYYSEVAGFEPCRLCWIQRGFMYPAAALLLVSLVKPQIRLLPLVLAVIGLAVSMYHRFEQQFPDELGGSCSLDNPCSSRWVDTFGVVTIPTMAAVAFALVIVFVLVSFEPDHHELGESAVGDTE